MTVFGVRGDLRSGDWRGRETRAPTEKRRRSSDGVRGEGRPRSTPPGPPF